MQMWDYMVLRSYGGVVMKVDDHGQSPAVQAGLRGRQRPKPAPLHELLAGSLDVAAIDAEHIGYPRCLAASAGDAVAVSIVDTPKQVPQDRRDEYLSAAASQVTQHTPRHGHFPPPVLHQGQDPPPVFRR